MTRYTPYHKFTGIKWRSNHKKYCLNIDWISVEHGVEHSKSKERKKEKEGLNKFSRTWELGIGKIVEDIRLDRAFACSFLRVGNMVDGIRLNKLVDTLCITGFLCSSGRDYVQSSHSPDLSSLITVCPFHYLPQRQCDSPRSKAIPGFVIIRALAHALKAIPRFEAVRPHLSTLTFDTVASTLPRKSAWLLVSLFIAALESTIPLAAWSIATT